MANNKKRRKPHSAVRNFAHHLRDNLTYYLIISLTLVAVVVTGVVLVADKGKVKETYIPSQTVLVTKTNIARDLEVTFIDVGQGDCILVKFPDGKNMLVDGGKSNTVVEKKIDEYLTVDGKKLKIDYCVATHPDADHVGSLDYVYANYSVGYSFRPYVKYSGEISLTDTFNLGEDRSCTSNDYKNYLTAVYNEKSGYEYFLNGSDFTNAVEIDGERYEYTVDFVMPYAESLKDYADIQTSNDFSAVIKISYRGKSILLCGDAESENIEKSLVNSYKNDFSVLQSDVLKVSHHGSKNATSQAFLNTVNPKYAVLSCGVANGYSHPDVSVLNRLASRSVVVMRTDLQGSVTVAISLDGSLSTYYETDANDRYLMLDGAGISDIADIVEGNKAA